MLNAVIQIKNAYEQARLEHKPEEALSLVEQTFDMIDPTALKAALAQSSSVFRKDCGQQEELEDGLNFTNDQLRQVNQEIFQLAMSAEDENVRTKNLHYIRDDKKGRKEVIKHLRDNTTFNILQFNQSLKEARNIADDMVKKLVEV